MRPPGRVRVVLRPAGPAAEGRIVDVSAGGLRLEGAPSPLAAGDPVTIEIRLEGSPGAAGDGRLVLDGAGKVVWTRRGSTGFTAGLSFDRPVDVRTPFPDLNVFGEAQCPRRPRT